MAPTTDWPAYQHDNRRSGKTDEQLPAEQLAEHWVWTSPQPPQPAWAGPAKYDAYSNVRPLRSMRNYDPAFHVIAASGCIFFGSSVDDSVHCLDAASGREKWRFTTDGPVRIAPACTGDKLYFGSDDGHAYCISVADGSLLWKRSPAPGGRRVLNNGRLIPLTPCRTGVLVDNGTAYFAAGMLPWEDSYLCAVDAETGRPAGPGRYITRHAGIAPGHAGHPHQEGITMEGALLASADRLFVPQGRVAPRMFDRANGDLLGSLEYCGGGCFALLSDDGQVIHGPGNKTGQISVNNGATGETIAGFDGGTAAVVAGNIIYVLTRTSLAAVDRKTGESAWTVPCDYPYSLILAGETLFAGGCDAVAAFDAVDGTIVWTGAVRGKAHGLAVANGQLLVTTDEGAIHAFGPDASATAKTAAGIHDPDEVSAVEEPTAPEDIPLSPYLRFLGSSTAVVRWETAEPIPTKLQYGLPGDIKTIEDAEPKTSHEATLTGLRKEMVHKCRTWTPEGEEVRFECDTHFDYTLPAIPDRPSPYPDDGGASARAVEAVLAEAAIDRGICLVLGCGDGRLAYEIAKQAAVRVIGFDSDAENIAAARRALGEAGVYGARVTVHLAGSLDRLPCVGGFANLIVGERSPANAEVRRLLRPGGGIALLGQPGAELERIKRPPLDGAGVWSHQYGWAGSAAYGGETLGGARGTGELEVQWLGRPGPRYQPDRNGRKPAPLAINGRLFGQGRRRIVALDAYNGTVIWSLEIPAFARFNMPRDCGNWCADPGHVFAAVKDKCWRIDTADGTVSNTFGVLPGGQEWAWDWGYVGDGGANVIGSAVKRGSAFVGFVGHANWYDAREGEPTFKVCSENLFALDKQTGETRWTHTGGVIVNPTIAIGEGRVYFAECRNEAVIASDSRRVGMPELWQDLFLVALDVKTGAKLWETPLLDIRPGSVVFYLAHSGTKVILMASDNADEQYHTYCFDAADGSARWGTHFDWMSDNHGGHMSHPAVAAGRVFVRPRVLDLETGEPLDVRMPGGGCGTYALTDDTAIFRAAHVVMWDFESDASTSWHRLRPGCWISTVPACGMVLSPEAGGGCSCGSWLETSIAFMPKTAK